MMQMILLPQSFQADRARAALKAQETRLKDLLDAIELNDAPLDAVRMQIESLEKDLRRIRRRTLAEAGV